MRGPSSSSTQSCARTIRLLIEVLAIGAAISGVVNLTGMPPWIVQHWEQTQFGSDFMSYLDDKHHLHYGDYTYKNLTTKRMGCGAIELAGALFLWPCHHHAAAAATSSSSFEKCECIGSSILLFMFAQGAAVNWKLGLDIEFLVTSIASLMALIILTHGLLIASSRKVETSKTKST